MGVALTYWDHNEKGPIGYSFKMSFLKSISMPMWCIRNNSLFIRKLRKGRIRPKLKPFHGLQATLRSTSIAN